jgi:branched-chain amino acid transport system ATP-binding protein
VTEARRGGRLVFDNVTVRFAGVIAINSVSLTIEPGRLVSLIGPNGAGKTSALNVISGVYRPTSGSARFDGHDLTRKAPYEIARLGIARTFQNLALFKGLSVLDNLLVGRYIYRRSGVLAGGFWLPRASRDEIRQREKVEEIIDLLEIQTYRHQLVGSLAYGVQKRVELGRALAMEPRLLLLDEPMAGMNLEEKEDMARFILDVRETLAPSILLIEHDMRVVMDIAERVAVLDFGRKIAEGTPAEVQANPAVVAAYLGTEGHSEQTVARLIH